MWVHVPSRAKIADLWLATTVSDRSGVLLTFAKVKKDMAMV